MTVPIETVRKALAATRGREDTRGMEGRCPESRTLHGPLDEFDLRIVCGPMERDRREATMGLSMTAAAAGFERNTTDAVLLKLRDDPSSVIGLCCGEGTVGSPQSYAHCPVFQRERERVAAGQFSLVDEAVPDSVGTAVGAEPGDLLDLLED